VKLVHSAANLKYGRHTVAHVTREKRTILELRSQVLRMQRGLVTVVILLCAAGCVSAPFDYPREPSFAISPTADTALRQQVELWRQRNPGPSGFFPLVSGTDALGARLRLTEIAEKSIDVQYFLMKGDTAGQVFTAGLLRAADRGVRVRFLLDDIFTTVKDAELELLNAHPNIELRLHNPISRRGISAINLAVTFLRANRRMHNKSFTVDNQVTIVGGRNIANEYFDLKPTGEFLDLDMIGIGPVAEDVSAVFDQFWNHGRSVPIEAFAKRYTADDLERARKQISETKRARGDLVYNTAVYTGLVQAMIGGGHTYYSADATVVTDEPDKLISKVSADQMRLVQSLNTVLNKARREVIVFTPYFVPGKAGVAFWKSIVDRGVRVILVTNSLASNNHTAVHAGYAKYRKRIIEAGVELHEVRVNAANGRASTLTLHTKGMIIDRETVFIGSLNLDPRSIAINSEMGMFISNPELGESMATQALDQISAIAYRVELDDRRRLRWRAIIDGNEVIEWAEPGATLMHRFRAFLLRVVPENQL
jgi:cardiolipin synthase C